MRIYEYKRLKGWEVFSIDALNKLGAEGWELVSVYYDKLTNENMFIFKKEKEEIIIKS